MQRVLLRAIGTLSLVFLLASCASIPKSQPMIDTMVIGRQYAQALGVLNDNPAAYGKNNELLYLLDKGLIEHFSGDYKESIDTFAKAQLAFDRLYTESVSKIAATWVINDYAAPYHGEDFEHVFINIFQALNYIMVGNYEEAMVEARDVDSKLNAINFQYKDDQKNVYKEDAFIRMLMGILYEAGQSREDLNDAFIAYIKAEKIYTSDYKDNYGLCEPELLKENILTTSRIMGLAEFSKYRTQYKQVRFIKTRDKKKKAEVYLIQYNGIAPVKTEASVPVPMPDGHIVKVAFPQYTMRPYGIHSSRLLAKDSGGNVFHAESELGQDIGAIARKNLDRRKVRFIAKSILRATGRYVFEKKQEENIQKKRGNIAANWFSFFSNMFNLIVERADVRSWQTLPDQIRIARLILDPGEYDFRLENFSANGSHLGEIKLQTANVAGGQKLFLLVHTTR